MKTPLSVLCRFAVVAAGLAAPLAAQTAPAVVAAAKKDEVISLSVFEVTNSRDIGYQSSNAAEATRMNTPIENTRTPFSRAMFCAPLMVRKSATCSSGT